MGGSKIVEEAERQLAICNSCRYCEGYCAVFPAIERERTFDVRNVEYLASLCHDCRDCLYACQYAPPHEFGVNIPKVLSEVRSETHRKYVWPQFMQGLARGVPWLSVRLALALVVVLFALVLAIAGPARVFALHAGPGGFYRVVSYTVMVTTFMILGLFWIGAWVAEGYRFWHAIGPFRRRGPRLSAMLRAAADAFSLRFMSGGGAGCDYPTQDSHSVRRKWFHHLVMYGFLLDFASTTLAAIYQHAFNLEAPYPVTNPVVILGALGGLGIIAGGIGLLVLKPASDKDAAGDSVVSGDVAFLTSLLLVAVTGMLLLAVRSTAAMGCMLAVHLGTVAAFFLTAPYNKFRHLVYRYIALVRFESEGDAKA